MFKMLDSSIKFEVFLHFDHLRYDIITEKKNDYVYVVYKKTVITYG